MTKLIRAVMTSLLRVQCPVQLALALSLVFPAVADFDHDKPTREICEQWVDATHPSDPADFDYPTEWVRLYQNWERSRR